jgi:hypothetical protein
MKGKTKERGKIWGRKKEINGEVKGRKKRTAT